MKCCQAVNACWLLLDRSCGQIRLSRLTLAAGGPNAACLLTVRAGLSCSCNHTLFALPILLLADSDKLPENHKHSILSFSRSGESTVS